MGQSIVVFDTEFTSWPTAKATLWGSPGEHREIIQIAARRWDCDGDWREGERFVSFVCPQISPKLSPFIKELTGITQKQVDTADTVEVVMRRFKKFASGALCYSNGNDINALAENFGLLGKKNPLSYTQTRTLYPWIYQKIEKTLGRKFKWQSYSSGRLYELFKIKLASDAVHDAMHDVDSLCATIEQLGNRGVRIKKLWNAKA